MRQEPNHIVGAGKSIECSADHNAATDQPVSLASLVKNYHPIFQNQPILVRHRPHEMKIGLGLDAENISTSDVGDSELGVGCVESFENGWDENLGYFAQRLARRTFCGCVEGITGLSTRRYVISAVHSVGQIL